MQLVFAPIQLYEPSSYFYAKAHPPQKSQYWNTEIQIQEKEEMVNDLDRPVNTLQASTSRHGLYNVYHLILPHTSLYET